MLNHISLPGGKVVRVTRRLTNICVLFVILFMTTSCGSGKRSSSARVVPDYSVTCVGVLPAVAMTGPHDAPDRDRAARLRTGAETMNRVLARELNSSAIKIRFVDGNYTAGLKMTGGESSLEMARLVGRKINCNAILESRVWRFEDRVGGAFTAKSPASVSFDMRLIGIETGTVLWSVRFDEVQKSVMENLYEFGKARSRGFTWITAEELMDEGVVEKLSASPYFKKRIKPANQYPSEDRV